MRDKVRYKMIYRTSTEIQAYVPKVWGKKSSKIKNSKKALTLEM